LLELELFLTVFSYVFSTVAGCTFSLFLHFVDMKSLEVLNFFES